MKNRYTLVLIGMLLLSFACNKNSDNQISIESSSVSANESQAKVTFIELGSVKCIPCKAMQPVMKAIEEEFGDQINVVFYDVWQPDQKHYAQQYNIRIIPTQVFLDEKGVEFHRHQGFYPKEEIEELLATKGLKKLNSIAY